MRLPVLSAVVCGAVIWIGPASASANSSTPISGVSGRVTVGPSCPGPERPGQACVLSFAGAKLQLRTPAGKVVHRASAAEDGAFSIAAPPGRYVLRVEVDGLYPRCEPTPLRVVKGRWTRLTLECDSGMR